MDLGLGLNITNILLLNYPVIIGGGIVFGYAFQDELNYEFQDSVNYVFQDQ